MQNKSYLSGRLDVKAFTLIELLVVVLIIGILAAVALPQYQKAVEKSKAAQALTMAKSIYHAMEAYHLANGVYPQSFSELSLEIPWTGKQPWADGTGLPDDVRSNSDWSAQLYNNMFGTAPAAAVGRLRGKYAGGAFMIYLPGGTHHYPVGVPVCAERVSGAVHNFTATPGSYCQKIFRAVLANGADENPRIYLMP